MAYKFLTSKKNGAYRSFFKYPAIGEWTDAVSNPALCIRGYHYFSTLEKAGAYYGYRFGSGFKLVLWEIEVKGPTVGDKIKRACRTMRLVKTFTGKVPMPQGGVGVFKNGRFIRKDRRRDELGRYTTA